MSVAGTVIAEAATGCKGATCRLYTSATGRLKDVRSMWRVRDVELFGEAASKSLDLFMGRTVCESHSNPLFLEGV